MKKKKSNYQKKIIHNTKKQTKKESVKEKEIQQEDSFIEKIAKHHFIFWFIIFFPIAIYKSIKYKIFPKIVNILFILFTLFLTFIMSLFVLNPTIGTDVHMKNNLKNKFDDFNEIITYEQYNKLDDYYIYDVITSSGRYDVYTLVNGDIYAIKEISPNLEDIYINKNFNENYKDIYSPILQFIYDNDIDISSNIEKLENTHNDTQEITIDGKKYEFILFLNTIKYVKIYENDSKNDLYENDECSLRMPTNLSHKFKKSKEIFDKLDYVSTIQFDTKNHCYSLLFYNEDDDLYQLKVFLDGTLQLNKEIEK